MIQKGSGSFMYMFLQETEFSYKASELPYFSSFGPNIKPDLIKFTVCLVFYLIFLLKSLKNLIDREDFCNLKLFPSKS